MYALASFLLTLSTLGFGRMSYGILMPFMKESLSLSYEQAGMLATANAIGYLSMVLFAGILSVKWGLKRLVISGTLLVAVGLLFMATIESYAASLVGMFALGIGTAFTYTPLVGIVVAWFPKRRGMMIGFLVSGFGLGTLISSLLIPLFTTWFSADGWRYLWFLYGCLSLFIVLFAFLILKEPPSPVLSKAHKDKSLWREVYLHSGVLTVAVIYGLIGFAYLIPQSFLFSFILESNINQFTAGNIMAIGGLMSIFSGPLWGMISDQIGRKQSLMMTLVTGASATIIPVIFPVFIGFVVSQFFWGITIVGMLSLVQALSTEQIHPSFAPVALAYATVFFASGQLFGPGLAGWVIDNMGGIPSALLLCCGLLVLAFLFSLRLKKREDVLEGFVHETLNGALSDGVRK